MPYDAGLAERLDHLLSDQAGFEQKKMFGGIGWLMRGNMCVGVWRDWLITRIGEDAARQVLDGPHAKPFDFTGRAMKGWAMIAPEGIGEDEELMRHVEMAIAFVSTLPEK